MARDHGRQGAALGRSILINITMEQELLAAARGAKIEVRLSEIRKKGLITPLRENARRG